MGSTGDLVQRILEKLQASVAELRAAVAQLQSSVDRVESDVTTIKREVATKRDLRRTLARFAAASSVTFVNAEEFERLVDRVEKLESQPPPRTS
jgi:hypothetical protein